jgi:Na+-translocating ferredoxin:NAD+ oxidoreductase RnfD subunit
MENNKKIKRKKIQNNIFIFFLIFIASVSSFDTALTVHTQESLEHLEKNPIARMILEYDGWHIGNFVGIKMFGTIIVLGILIFIFKKNIRWGLVISFVLSLFQGLLLLYLLL